MRPGDPTCEFHNALAKKETDAAILCVIDDKEYWIPKSEIADESDVKEEDDEGTLVVSEWIATQKGLV